MKIPATDMKNSFGKYLRLCSTEPVYITKNGEIIAKLINYTKEDDIIENSINLRKVYDVDYREALEYPHDRLEEAMEAYNLDRVKMTYEEFQMMNKEAKHRYEYIDGEVYMLASPNFHHQRLVSRLHIAFYQYLVGKPCEPFESPFDVVLCRRGNRKFLNVVQPDLLIICDWKDDIDENGRYTGIPELVVEVLSPSNSVKEMITKLDLYRDSGIKEYWILDPKRESGLIYRFDNYEVIETRIISEKGTCESSFYPGMTFDIADEA